jgi:hypothetical protein
MSRARLILFALVAFFFSTDFVDAQSDCSNACDAGSTAVHGSTSARTRRCDRILRRDHSSSRKVSAPGETPVLASQEVLSSVNESMRAMLQAGWQRGSLCGANSASDDYFHHDAGRHLAAHNEHNR